MLIDDDILLAELMNKNNQSVLLRRVYSPPSLIALDAPSIDSGSSYVQPENSGGVWGTHS